MHNNSNIPFVTQNIPSNFSSSYLQDGDIVMADTAEDETVGKSTEISSLSSNDRVLAGLHTIPLSPKQKFGSGFLGFYLNSNSYHDKLRPLMQGIKVTSISKTNLKNTILQFPKELEEQKRIGKLFIKLNRTITLHEEKQCQLEQLKKALLQKMFADETGYPVLRFKGFTEKWEQRKLGEIATIVGGGTPSTKNPEYWDGDINWYSPAEIGNQIYTEKSERQITELGLKKSSAKLLPVGTVLFTSRAGIGKTAILNKEACTNQGFQSIIPRSKMLNSYFLFSRTNSLKQYGETMGSGSTFVEVSGKQMSKMPLFIPNINEQSRIAKLFQSLDKTITLHDKKIQYLKQLKRGLLQKMFV